jgi:hypothetical protein
LAKVKRLGDADWYGLTVIAIIGVGFWLFRFQAIQPFWTVGACAGASRPGFCLPRAAVLWLQYQQAFGWAAFILGVAAFALGRRPLAVLAIAIGIAAVVNFNATTGILGAALGVFAWFGVKTGRYKAA